MANKRMDLSGTGKEILETLCDRIEVERPTGIKIALAKGIAHSVDHIPQKFIDNKKKWTIPDNIIRDKEYLLFKHLIINEVQETINEEQLNDYFLHYIEHGLRFIQNEIKDLSSLEDYRIKVLN